MAMAIIGVLLIAVAGLLSAVHGIGMLLFAFILHGLLVNISHDDDAVVRFPLIASILLMVIVLVKGNWRGVDSMSGGILLTTLTIIAFASLLGINQDASLMTMIPYAKAFGFAYLVAGVMHTQHDYRVVGKYLLLALSIGAAYAIWQKITGNFTINSLYQQRAAGLRGDPNDTAMLLIAGVPVAFYYMRTTRTLLFKLFYAGIFIALLYSIILTGSRGAFVALLMIAGIVFYTRPSLKLFLAGVFIAAIGILIMPDSYQERMTRMFQGKEEEQASSMDNRRNLLKAAGEIYVMHPILGIGLGNFGLAFKDTEAGKLMADVHEGEGSTAYNKDHLAVHNMYVEFFVENGSLAGILFLLFLYHSSRGFIRIDQVLPAQKVASIGFAFMLGLLGMLFCGIFLSQGYNSVLWLYLGFGIAGHKMQIPRPAAPKRSLFMQ